MPPPDVPAVTAQHTGAHEALYCVFRLDRPQEHLTSYPARSPDSKKSAISIAALLALSEP